MNKGTHIKDSLHLTALEMREKNDDVGIGSRVYVAHIPYSIMRGYIITARTDDNKFIMNGVPISATHEAIYINRNEAIEAMIKKLKELMDK